MKIAAISLFLLNFACLILHGNAKSVFHNTKPVSLPNIFQNQIASTSIPPALLETTAPAMTSRDISIGPCTWVIDRKCPDADVKFYLYTRQNAMDRECIHIDETLDKSNLTSSHFDPSHPTKIIVHGYNSDMFLSPLQKMRHEYLAKQEYNLIYVDWSILSPGPCYISAVHNTRHAGRCVAQLVDRMRDYGNSDIHAIGFSLGAQLTNYIAQNISGPKLPRITGLDPAMPLFITAKAEDKLDETDAEYVDVFHTNALVQGKLEKCGHSDFYMNGGIMQPGCNSPGSNPFACSHQRSTAYFLESIRSNKGFWGWPCSSYVSYLLGMCPPTNNLHEAGEYVRRTTRGMFFVETNDTAPYALGKWTDLPTLGVKRPVTLIITPPRLTGDPLLKQIDQWGKLEYNFNNLNDYPTPSSQDPYTNGWTYFSHDPTPDDNSKFDNDESIEELAQDKISKNDFTGIEEAEQVTVRWDEYRRNLTQGIIDSSIFTVPHIRDVPRNWKRG